MLTTSHRTASETRVSKSWLCLDTDPRKRIHPNHTGPSNCTGASNKCHRGLIVFTVANEYGEVRLKFAISCYALLLLLLATSYMVVTVTRHTNKLTLFRHTNHSETSCCSHRVCTSSGASPLGPILSQTGRLNEKNLCEP